jgi:pyruvate dehydrogenase E2 component (dihydrolipoamide acetyltransferase)
MATSVIMPALEMAQESGRLLRWLKSEGDPVTKGEALMEVETDKVTVEIPSPGSGILGGILIKEGDEVPVGQTIAWLLAPGEPAPVSAGPTFSGRAMSTPAAGALPSRPKEISFKPAAIEASPLARKIAEENGVDLTRLNSAGRRIEKADVLAYLGERAGASQSASTHVLNDGSKGRLLPASPKARRLAAERNIELGSLQGSGPEGAVLAADVPEAAGSGKSPTRVESLGTVWRLMAERMSESWTSVPHFCLTREVNAGSLIEWRQRIAPIVEKRAGAKPTFTDLLIKLAGVALQDHPHVNAAWVEGGIRFNQEINVGIAVAVEEGLIVPVIRRAGAASISEITTQRRDLVERAQSRRLRSADISDGTFTLSNLGMYNVDAFNAIINTPQAAILAVGRIADRVVPVDGQAVIRPMMVMTLSCDHRVVDGARAARFLDDLANLIVDPWRLLA